MMRTDTPRGYAYGRFRSVWYKCSYLEQTQSRRRITSRELAPATSCSCESSAYLIRGDCRLGPISGASNDRPNLPESQSADCICAGYLDILHLRDRHAQFVSGYQ